MAERIRGPRLVEQDAGWAVAAACAGQDPRVFASEDETSVREAKAICARCSVRRDCLEAGVTDLDSEGIWGGLTRLERSSVRRSRAARRRRAEQPRQSSTQDDDEVGGGR